ncbi:hypothetical protein JCM19238_5224 [Vibrio ponticus]|nr:hypothetical protein JCM19238_5224 [Vibrio ponticus]
MASYALEVANDSKRQAGYSQESARACLQTLAHVKAELDRFEQTCNQQSSLLSQLDSEANQAFLQVRDLETQHESIQGEVFTLKYTLQDKTSLLIAYDQPLSSR